MNFFEFGDYSEGELYGGHAWVLDGYKIIHTCVVFHRVDNDAYYTTQEFVNGYFSMKWGYGGKKDGYYKFFKDEENMQTPIADNLRLIFLDK